MGQLHMLYTTNNINNTVTIAPYSTYFNSLMSHFSLLACIALAQTDYDSILIIILKQIIN